MSLRLLITRPQSDGERTAAKLRGARHRGAAGAAPAARERGRRSRPALRRSSDHQRQRDRGDRASIRAGPSCWRCRVFVVGQRTAEAARAAGFAAVASANGNQHDLARLIAARYSDGCAAALPRRRGSRRRSGGRSQGRRACACSRRWSTAPRRSEAFPPDAAEALSTGRLDGVLHFSRRSAETYLDCADKAGMRPARRSISHITACRAQVAEPLAAAGAPRIRVAARPEEAALFDLLRQS